MRRAARRAAGRRARPRTRARRGSTRRADRTRARRCRRPGSTRRRTARRGRRAGGSARRAPTAVLQPKKRLPRRWASVKPVLRNSFFVITGTGRPRNAVWRCTENGSGRAAAVGHLPAQDVEHGVVDPHPEADDAVLRRGHAGGERRERGGGRGRDDGRDRAARHRAQLGQRAAVCLELRPAEPVEHEQDDRARRRPRARGATCGARPWSSVGHDLIEGSGSVGSLHRLHYRVHQSNVLRSPSNACRTRARSWSDGYATMVG